MLVPADVTEDDILGNSWADKHAEDIARVFQVPMGVSSKYLHYYHMIRKIQKRLVSIVCQLPNRPKHIPVPRETFERETVNNLAMKSDHFIIRRGASSNVYSCAKCNMSYSSLDPGIKNWLRGSCSGKQILQDVPVPIQHHNLHIGRQDIHHTHRIHLFCGIYYCNRCGCRATSRAIYLAKRCEEPRAAGLAFLRAVQTKGMGITGCNKSKDAQDRVREQIHNVAESTLDVLQNAADVQDKNQPALAKLAMQFASLSSASNSACQHYSISTPRSEDAVSQIPAEVQSQGYEGYQSDTSSSD